MRNWNEPPEISVPRGLRTAVGGHPLVAQTLVRRGITDSQQARAFLDPGYYRRTPATELPAMSRAVERLERALERDERIWVWGDFDVDGQTATTILVSSLRDLGGSIQFHIPNREREGHGVNLPLLKDLVAQGADVVLTCDTGVTAHDPLAYARAQGVDVIVTDHHDLPPNLPDAYAIIDPKMLRETHALRELPGVGVAYKVVEQLYHCAGRSEQTRQYLDLVALGIVADVATQTGDVRYLLQLGLEALRHTKRLGLRVLMEVAELNPQRLTEEHIGFELAPRLNALGRLADATPAVEFLSTNDLERARLLAHQLDGLNARRKMVCDQVAQAAKAQIERDPSLLERGALVLSHPSWPGGVIGIVAGRLAERYHRPTILIAAPQGELARGSARSVPGCDISAAIAAQGDMLEGFGGHPMAAGLSIDPKRIPEFRRALSRIVEERCESALEKEPELQIDGYVSLADLTLEFVEDVERLAPFGPGNPPPTLATRGVSLKTYTTVGRTGEHLKLTVEDEEGGTQEVLWWQGDESALPKGPFDLAYAVRASDYRGQRDVQVEWIDARPIEEPEATLCRQVSTIEVVDYRDISHPQRSLARLRAQKDPLVWVEGESDVPGCDRYALAPSETLVIWSTPPGAPELRDALAHVSPKTVYLFGIDPGFDHARGFLTRLARLTKGAIRTAGGVTQLSTLAAATGQREETAAVGLGWLEARGDVVILEEREDDVRLAPGKGESSGDLPGVVSRLRSLLEETRAYRAYFARAKDPTALINNTRLD